MYGFSRIEVYHALFIYINILRTSKEFEGGRSFSEAIADVSLYFTILWLTYACMQNSKRLEELGSKQGAIKETVDKIPQLLSGNSHLQQHSSTVANMPPEYLVNGRDVIHMQTMDGYPFGLRLMPCI